MHFIFPSNNENNYIQYFPSQNKVLSECVLMIEEVRLNDF